jgi:hypothetical protein
MTGEFEKIPAVVAAAIGALGDELTFSFPEVLQVIRLCIKYEIAVLGLETFQVLPEGYATKKLSGYDQQMNKGPGNVKGWSEYVARSNALAEEFVRANPSGDDHVYILTTSSWREFCKIQEMKQKWANDPEAE